MMGLSDRDRKILWARAGNRCSYRFKGEACSELLVFKDGGKYVNIGVECHIVGEKQSAARYVEDYPASESYSNRILMCQNHHKLVDDDEDTYTAEVLEKMKRSHEEAILRATQNGEIERIVIRDSQFTTVVEDADRAVGMQLNRPAELSNVKSELRVGKAEEAIGFSTNQPLTTVTVVCSCNHPFSRIFLGAPPPSVDCPRCGETHNTH
ncbi:MAG: hypothetical protein WBB22_15655 [Anaerolineae bacterium]